MDQLSHANIFPVVVTADDASPRPSERSTTGIVLPEPLVADWSVIVTPPDAILAPASLPSEQAAWQTAPVPGTALQALLGPDARPGVQQDDGHDAAICPLHDRDVWYRAAIRTGEGETITFHGLAGLAEIWIDDQCVGTSASMFVSLRVAVPGGGVAMRASRFRARTRAGQAAAGRSRWRTKLVTSNSLRHHRQTLLGHMPGWCPPFHAVGPFRPVVRIGVGTIECCRLSSTLRGSDGVVSVSIRLAPGTIVPPGLSIGIDGRMAPLRDDGHGNLAVELLLQDVRLWWPHTHGMPTLYDVSLVGEGIELRLGRTGFRTVRVLQGEDGAGFAIEINGTPVFCRGACWTSANLVGLNGERDAYVRWLRLVQDGGMNMVRVGGTMAYESRSFHELCDEMGILVWQDLMFANLDYAVEQQDFRDSVVLEVEQLIERLSASPSLAVLCGGSEIAQQATMLGLDAGRRRMPFFEIALPALIGRLKPDLFYVPHSPWGGPLPITVGAGVAHYYGVGAYRRPLEDARRADVRFATECLAFANPPSAASPCVSGLEHGPRDRGVAWTFADIRDHYLRELYGMDPARLRGEETERYWQLSRAVTADLMEAVLGEWRRPQSRCAGALVWQLQDVAPGSGWGVIDSHGYPKAAWHGLRRVLAPVQILLSDEGCDGLALHVLNETALPVAAVVELACLKRGTVPVATARHAVTVAARDGVTLSSQSLLDGFFDISRAYRFGPPEHDVTVAVLRCAATDRVLSEAFHFPSGRCLPRDDLGLSATLSWDDGWVLDVAATRFAQAVQVSSEGYRPSDDWFHLPPGRTRRVSLLPDPGISTPPSGVVEALNGMQAVSFRGRA